MLLSSIPAKFNIPWAKNAGGGFITTPIPQTTVSPGRASLDQGFPTTTFEPEASGGNPPFGADMNGILYELTQWQQWNQAGGWVGYDSAFQTAISGYPNRAMIQSATAGHYWISTADNNASNPDSGGANWVAFPDLLIQQQAGNYTVTDSGAVNAAAITLSPAPASWTAIKMAPIRFLIAFTNTTTAVTLNVNGLGTKTLKNTDGTAMDIGQLTAGGLVEGFYDGTNVQVASPGHVVTPGGTSLLPPGAIVLCPNEIPFAGTLECNGASLLRSAYPNLFNSIGTRYGAADGNHFNIPDMRGLFARGWDHGRGADPSAGTRAAPGTLAPTTTGATGPAGDHVGTTQAAAVGPITAATISIVNPLLCIGEGNTWGGAIYTSFATGPTTSGTPANFWNAVPDPVTHDVYHGIVPTTGPYGVNPEFDIITTGSATLSVPAAWYNGTNVPYPVGPNWMVQSVYGSGNITTNSPETRPINIGMMYVIAY